MKPIDLLWFLPALFATCVLVAWLTIEALERFAFWCDGRRVWTKREHLFAALVCGFAGFGNGCFFAIISAINKSL